MRQRLQLNHAPVPEVPTSSLDNLHWWLLVKNKLVNNRLAKNKLGCTPRLERTFASRAWSSSPKRPLSSRMRSYSPLGRPRNQKRRVDKPVMHTPAGCVSGSVVATLWPGPLHAALVCQHCLRGRACGGCTPRPIVFFYVGFWCTSMS